MLGIFAKEPVAGRVKTRFCPPLSPEEAAALYRTSLEETVATMRAFSPVIFYAGESDYFRATFPGVPLHPQGEGDLGERMDRALRGLLLSGVPCAALIGSDSPDLDTTIIEEAFAALDEVDVVIAPSRDGGYVLIGERRHHPPLFADIPWSTGDVLALTRQRCAERRIDFREVRGWDDLDDIVSLRRLLERSPRSATAAHGRRILQSV